MGIFGLTSPQETMTPIKGVESSVEKKITGLDSVRVIEELDCTVDGKFLTPTHAVSEYSEQEWKTLRTEGFLNVHPEWKALYESQKEWQNLAIKETLMQRQYGHHIDDRNRFLDSLRFAGVEKRELTKEMIEAIGKQWRYESPSLVNEIYDRYEREIRNRGTIPPENPSEAYQKYTALERRNRAYLENIWHAQDVTNELQKQSDLEEKQAVVDHTVAIESQDMVEQKNTTLLEKESLLKAQVRNSVKKIPFLDHMEWRPHFRDGLRVLRKDHSEDVAFNQDNNESVHVGADNNTAALSREEMNEVHAEGQEAVSAAINALILEYKAPSYDEAGTKKRIVELEEKIAQLVSTIPYLNTTGEPNKETLQAYLS